MVAMNNQSGSGNLPEIRRVEIVQQAPTTKLVADREFVGVFRAADATPSVINLTKFTAGNVGANNVTYFDDGFDGQEISILGDGFTTIVHDITSANDSTHMDGSLHPKGLAIDIRTRDIDPELVTELAKALKLKLNGSVLINRPYQVIIEIDHIHIEFDPK